MAETVRYFAFFGLFILLLGYNQTFAQSSRDSESSSTESSKAFYKEKKASKKFYKKGKNQTLVDEYEELQKANKKKYRKMAKGMQKPQYSDPTYFGHKRPPKKRKLGKRKFCKECGMVH